MGPGLTDGARLELWGDAVLAVLTVLAAPLPVGQAGSFGEGSFGGGVAARRLRPPLQRDAEPGAADRRRDAQGGAGERLRLGRTTVAAGHFGLGRGERQPGRARGVGVAFGLPVPLGVVVIGRGF